MIPDLNKILDSLPGNKLRVVETLAPPAFITLKIERAISILFVAIIKTESPTFNPRFLNADANLVTLSTISL